MAEFLVTIVVRILPNVLSLASSEVVVAWGFKEKLEALHRTLELINAMLDDADRQKSRGPVMVWLKQLKHAIDEADDVLDEIHYENMRREVKKRKWMARKVSSLPSLKKLSFRIEMGHKIENVNLKLNEINKQANALGLQNQQPSVVQYSLSRETDPYSDEFKVVGRENEELHLIQLLTQSRKEEKLTIVPIVGMGGIGKTTLAKAIYNNPTIQQHFDVKYWLCVSVKTDVDKLLAKIYESLAGEECKSKLRPDLIENLQYKLGSKRYFLVMDDVWDEESEYWDDFKSCMFKVNLQTGSGILVTTRNLEIGTKAAASDEFHALQSLPDDKCWSIFKERAFVAGQSSLPELEEIGRDILKKCRGLHERGNKDAEDVGNDVFQILVSSSLFQDVKRDEYGYVTCCMHDLVHDLSLSLSKHESLCLVDLISDEIAHIPQVKHVAIYEQFETTVLSEKITFVIFKNGMTARTLHTLILRGEIEKNVSFQSFKCMKS